MTVLIPGDHEVVTTEPPDLRSLKFTHTKQRGTIFIILFEHVYIMSSGKKKRRAYEGEIPDPPDPGKKGAEFLAWLKNLGPMWDLKKCGNYSAQPDHNTHLHPGCLHNGVQLSGS